jgi:hypothetical protein
MAGANPLRFIPTPVFRRNLPTLVFAAAEPLTVGTLCSMDYRTFIMGYRTLIMGYRTLIMDYRTLIMGYRTFIMGYRTFIMDYRTLIMGHRASIGHSKSGKLLLKKITRYSGAPANIVFSWKHYALA